MYSRPTHYRFRDLFCGLWQPRNAFVLLIIGIIIAYFLVTRHYAHVLLVLPFLFLLACPLMHLLMHGSHGHQHSQNNTQAIDK